MSRKHIALFVALLLVLASCSGSGGDGGANGGADPEAETETETETTVATGEGAPSVAGPEPAALLRAFADSESAVSVAYSTGTELDVDGTDLDIDSAVDVMRPSFVETVGSDGTLHTRMDVGTGAAVWAEGFFGPEVALAFSGVELQLWETADQLVIDTSSFEAITPVAESVNIGGNLGPFEPDVWSLDRPELKAGLISQTTAFGPFIDINVLQAEGGTFNFATESLPALIESLDAVEEGGVLRASVPYGDVADLMGLDLTRTLLAVLFPIQESVPTPAQQIAAMDLVVSTARSATAELTAGPLPDNPAVVQVTVTVDLSDMFQQLDADSAVDLSNAADTVDGAELRVEHNIQVGLSPVFPPLVPEDVNDRSAEFAGVQ